MKTKKENKEKVQELIAELASHIFKAQQLIASIEKLAEKEKDSKGWTPSIASVDIDNCFEKGAKVHCCNFDGVLDYEQYGERYDKVIPHERYKMINGIKFFEIGNYEKEIKNEAV